MKKIEFYCDATSKDAIPHPTPAKKYIPDWFRNLNTDVSYNESTIKRCMPFLDIMTSGYIIPLWQDFYIKHYTDDENNDGIKYFWGDNTNGDVNECISHHSYDQIKGSPLSKSQFGHIPMKFNSPWIIKTPPGYSCLFTAPYNRHDQPFQLISAVVDTDLYFNKINFPFVWITPGFDGVLSSGTPLVQVIPFKRDDWSHSVNGLTPDLYTRFLSNKKAISLKFKKAYRDRFWSRKRYT